MSSSTFSLKRIGWNTVSVLGGDVLNKASIFLVYAILARHSGVHEFGQLSLGLLLLYTFHVFAVAGLPTALTREVAKRRGAAKRLLRHGYLAVLIPATLSVISMAGFALAMQYERDTLLVISLLALAILPYAMAMITESVIKGREQMHLITLGNIPGNLLLVGLCFGLLVSGYGVVALAGVIIVSRVVTFITMHTLLYVSLADCSVTRTKPLLAWLLLKHSMVFLGTDGVNAVWAALNGVLLSKFATERELGLLGASFQLLQPILMFYRSVGHSCFPSLVSAARTSKTEVGRISRTLIGLLLRLAFPATLVTFFLAGDMLAFVYGNDDFRSGAIVLQIVAFTLLLDPMNPVLGHGLWAMGHDKAVFRIVIVNLIVNLVVGVVLISQFGLIGAAYSALISSFVNVAQHYWCFERRVSHLSLGGELARIAPAAVSAIALMYFLPTHLYVSLALAVVVYLCLAFGRLDHFSIRNQAPHHPGT